MLLIVSDAAGRKVRWIEGPASEGLHRVSWDLRGPAPDPVVLDPPAFRSPWDAPPIGPLVAPGRYSAELVLLSASGARSLGATQSFEVKPVPLRWERLPGRTWRSTPGWTRWVSRSRSSSDGSKRPGAAEALRAGDPVNR